MNVALEIQQIILFFIFVAPGFYFSRTYFPFRPIQYFKQRSIFEQTALALIGSAIIHGALLSVATLLVLIFRSATGQVLILSQVLNLDTDLADMSLSRLSVYLVGALGYLFVSLILARRAGIFFGKGATGRSHIWNRIIGEDLPENLLFWPVILQAEALQKGILNPKVTVRLRNGDTFEGVLNRLKMVGDEEDTVELALTDVRHFSGPDQPYTPHLENHIVLLQSKDILWISRVDRVQE